MPPTAKTVFVVLYVGLKMSCRFGVVIDATSPGAAGPELRGGKTVEASFPDALPRFP
jgi:hypothetical protein